MTQDLLRFGLLPAYQLPAHYLVPARCLFKQTFDTLISNKIEHFSFLIFQIIVSVKEDVEGHREMKDFVRKTGIPLVKEKLAKYIKELKEGMYISL